MGKDKRRIQQNKAKKRARRAAHKGRSRQSQGDGGSPRFARLGCSRGQAERAPLHKVWTSSTIIGTGMGHVVISRLLPDGRVIAGFFLVDIYCLGVKDAFLAACRPGELEEKFHSMGQSMVEVSPAYARKLIEDAMAYAASLGLEPHEGFQDAAVVLGDINPADCTEIFTFGLKGKPFYVNGPHHTEAQSRVIIAQLEKVCGRGGFDFLLGMGDLDAIDDDEVVEVLDGEDENQKRD